ncbi:MAG: hypothetical protein QOF58_2985 [Pseudonocardiales bacterium]|jgi:hypothetical protein|nr:hypothetical protein [Pseudonocardiales bacterium]
MTGARLGAVRRVGLRRYWRHWRLVAWWFTYVWPDKCVSCGRRWRGHRKECYFA